MTYQFKDIIDYLELVARPENYYTDPSDVSDHYIAPTEDDPDPDDLTGLVFVESAELVQREDLEAAAVGQDGSRPPHELV